jgi:hypothetical protein
MGFVSYKKNHVIAWAVFCPKQPRILGGPRRNECGLQ